ncbi:hypothetical protein K431DRAFT_321704 [Polychaeton citri CBS 116435]|uniref:Zn(2)-C6 fungal-type domain-containing protein n=1 Tax=Polychaeton citri CBS 116435 TaxID=1314669 RepID=A0A9P4Q2K2_9PEZI|nr:hypothetical protein K431DRAFT_321704 [Polychaeton citri CBS 116435]
MTSRLPACEPCRSSKLACDHTKPVCSRCRNAKQATQCIYRDRPFKKRRRAIKDHNTPPGTSGPDAPFPLMTAGARTYPNPGYLGASSHTSIFSHLSANEQGSPHRSSSRADNSPGERFLDFASDAQVTRGAALIDQFCNSVDLACCTKLVYVWLQTGVNLALAGFSTVFCCETAEALLSSDVLRTNRQEDVSRRLLEGSLNALDTQTNVTAEEFCASFCHGNARWETLGLFFTAVSRATVDLKQLDGVYISRVERRKLQRLALHFSDCCLEIALSLDSLNDLQLMLQYESFVVHSLVSGDQSYQSWRKLGDIISTLFALGYHEHIDSSESTPGFLTNLRRVAFARTYSTDKNVSIFLGRPPRIHRKYCRLQLPSTQVDDTVQQSSAFPVSQRITWSVDHRIDSMAETQWTAVCALLKEEVLDIFRESDLHERARKAHVIEADAEAQWSSLPSRFRVEGPLKDYDCRPNERDFLVSVRLNYLHVFFLLRLALSQRTTSPDANLVSLSSAMLSLVAEAILYQSQLANSGTSLIWKETAGTICLALLDPSANDASSHLPLYKTVQDLNVLVAEVDAGALIEPEDPNYALLYRATCTIKNIITRMLSSDSRKVANDQSNAVEPLPQSTHHSCQDWMFSERSDLWDFDEEFWASLAGHPLLSGPDPN